MKIFTLIFTFVFPILTFAQVDIKLNNNCLETKYTFFRQGTQEQQFLKKYDSEGNLVNQVNVFSSRNTGDYTEEYDYSYDKKGNNTNIIYKRNNVLLKNIEKTFDTSGKILKESTNTTLNKISEKTASNNGTESIQIFFDNDGKTESFREKSTFNAAGDLLKKEVLSPNGNVMIADSKTYNTFGKISQEIHFDATDKVSTQTDFVFDLKGNIVSDKTLRNDVVFAETKNEYDLSSKLLKKTRLNGKGLVDYYFTYDYDALGNMTNENYFYNDKKISVRTFEYDTKGNKTKETYYDRNGNVSMNKTWEYSCK